MRIEGVSSRPTTGYSTKLLGNSRRCCPVRRHQNHCIKNSVTSGFRGNHSILLYDCSRTTLSWPPEVRKLDKRGERGFSSKIQRCRASIMDFGWYPRWMGATLKGWSTYRMLCKANVDWRQLLVHEVDIWRPEACCKMVWEAGLHDSTYLESLADLEHRYQHRLCETTRMEMNDRSRCVIKWDLVDLRVNVLCCWNSRSWIGVWGLRYNLYIARLYT